MKIEVVRYQDCWQDIKEATMATISKRTGKYPDSEWKTRILRSEHSPIRLGVVRIRVENIPSWVSVHFARHHVGVEKFISTKRTDRTGIDRNLLPQNEPVIMELYMNFQAIMNISRVRLCTCASNETRNLWRDILNVIEEYEPELVALCQPKCVDRGYCPEFIGCGMVRAKTFDEVVEEFRNYKGE